MFVASDDADAKAAATQLVGDAGFDPVDTGPLSSARNIEALGMLMINLAYVQGHGPNIGLRVVEEDR